MWELIVGDIPFHDVPNLDGMLPIFWQVEHVNQVRFLVPDLAQDGRRPPLDVEPFESVPRKLRQLIEKCWNADRYNWL